MQGIAPISRIVLEGVTVRVQITFVNDLSVASGFFN